MFEHDFPFDPTYGYDEAGLLGVKPPPLPDDFEAFWRGQFARAGDVPLHVHRKPCRAYSTREVQVEEIAFDAMGLAGARPMRLGGWLTYPAGAAPVRAEVLGHGYGGRSEPVVERGRPPAVRLVICMRGFGRSAARELPADAARHVLVGIESRETYIHLGCAADAWAAVKCLAELFPELQDRIDYAGSSFGGGIGALAMAWDGRVGRVALDVPSFGHHPLRLSLPCRGSGEAVRMYQQRHGDVLGVLRYFDAATAGRFLRQPTFVSAARFDPAVPPPGQVCVFNAIPGERKALLLRDGGHFEYPGLAAQQRVREDAMEAWFAV